MLLSHGWLRVSRAPVTVWELVKAFEIIFVILYNLNNMLHIIWFIWYELYCLIKTLSLDSFWNKRYQKLLQEQGVSRHLRQDFKLVLFGQCSRTNQTPIRQFENFPDVSFIASYRPVFFDRKSEDDLKMGGDSVLDEISKMPWIFVALKS